MVAKKVRKSVSRGKTVRDMSPSSKAAQSARGGALASYLWLKGSKQGSIEDPKPKK